MFIVMSSNVVSCAVTELFPLAKCTIRQSGRFQQQVICSVPVVRSVPVETNYLYLCFQSNFGGNAAQTSLQWETEESPASRQERKSPRFVGTTDPDP
jgi:hypothetical protein